MSNKRFNHALKLSVATVAVLSTFALPAIASSHREAPFITTSPKVDGTDFYMFKSYEPSRKNYTTLIANYVPLQDAYGGPNYFTMDHQAVYEIKIDNDGDSVENMSFQFKFQNTNKNASLSGVPTYSVVSDRGITQVNDDKINVRETFTVDLVRTSKVGNQYQRSNPISLTKAGSSEKVFDKPIDNIGNLSIPDYAAYAKQHIYSVTIPGCSTPGRVFVGQRKESFVVNLGKTFDLLNINPLGPETGDINELDDKNVTSIAMEVPTSCLTSGSETVIGGWTTASLPQFRALNDNPDNPNSALASGPMVQVSRLSSPLVNEVVIGLKDKDKFNKSQPKNDVRDFAPYVLSPTVPKLIDNYFFIPAPTFDRTDLVTVFLTGLKGLNQPANVQPGEMVRLNTAFPANPTPLASQSPLGVLSLKDFAGYPNGRRPVDDVVDITLRAAEGILCTKSVLAATQSLNVNTGCNGNVLPDSPYGAAFTDGARAANNEVSTEAFPYLLTPLAGARNP